MKEGIMKYRRGRNVCVCVRVIKRDREQQCLFSDIELVFLKLLYRPKMKINKGTDTQLGVL